MSEASQYAGEASKHYYPLIIYEEVEAQRG